MDESVLAPKKKLGFIVNPIAGLGGRVGLKGTDGEATIRRAVGLGATAVSPLRALETLQTLSNAKDEFGLVTYPYEMGQDVAKTCGLDYVVIGSIAKGKTTATDTKKAAINMVNMQVDLILFSGGDGTARDICEAIDLKVPALGIPAGVKMHSAVFAVNPKKAGELAINFLHEEAPLREAEVMDVDEDAFRRNRVSARLYGYLRVPYEVSFVQPMKNGSPSTMDEKSSQESIAEYIVERMDDKCYYILGPGTTIKAIADKLGIKKTLLGVDVVKKRRIAAMDVNEEQLLTLIENKKAKIVVSPIGGQGFIFGRGNQQISPQVIRSVGIDNVVIVATKNKLCSIGTGRPLLVDTGDDEVDRLLCGYRRVITSYNEEVVVKVTA
jgi:predicted polyphosphate/ATP-dependent NAD kinase